MRYEYTIKASVIYQIHITADDEDDAIEKAQGIVWSNWTETDAELFIDDIEPVQRIPPNDDH